MVHRRITSPRWHAFQDSLAACSGLTLWVLDPQGDVIATHDPRGNLAGSRREPADESRLATYLQALPSLAGCRDGVQVVHGPDGTPVGVINLPGGGHVALAESPVSPFPRESLPACRPPVDGSDFELRVKSIADVYHAMLRADEDMSETGRPAELLTGAEQLNQEQLGMLLDAIRHAALVISTRGTLALLNETASVLLKGMGVHVAVGQPFFNAGMSGSIENGVRLALAGQGFEQDFDPIPGRFLSWTASPLVAEGGVVSGCLLMIEDVTESALLRARARDWEKLVIAGQMAADMAHEIRNPLAAAIGALQLMSGRQAAGDAGLLQRLEGELQRINSILSSYLALSHPNGSARPVLFDPRRPVRDVLFLLQSDANTHGIELVVDLPQGEFPLCAGKPDALKQVLLNLARNSMEAMGSKGRLEIRLEDGGHEIAMTVHDTGPGIPNDMRRHLFQPFFTTKPHGTGLGLSVTRELVRQMRGGVELSTDGKSWTKAVVRLPVADAVPQTLEPANQQHEYHEGPDEGQREPGNGEGRT